MIPIPEDLATKFSALADDELSRQASSGNLSDLAQSLALAEADARGLVVPAFASTGHEPVRYGDMQIVEKNLTPTEAHVMCSCLQAAGVPAVTGDVNLVQAYSLLSIAVGGACIRVPPAFVAEARDVIAAYKRGEFALEDDFEGDVPS